MSRVRWECRPDCTVCADSRQRRRRDPLPPWALLLLFAVAAVAGFCAPLWDAMPWAVNP